MAVFVGIGLPYYPIFDDFSCGPCAVGSYDGIPVNYEDIIRIIVQEQFKKGRITVCTGYTGGKVFKTDLIENK